MSPIVLDGMNPELMDGARNAMETCLAVQPGERVALIFDRAKPRSGCQPRPRARTAPGKMDSRFCVEDFAPRPLQCARAGT